MTKPCITAHDVTVRVKTQSKKITAYSTRNLTRAERETFSDANEIDDHRRYTCDADIEYVSFAGHAKGFLSINRHEKAAAAAMHCSINDASVSRAPRFIHASPALVSTAVFEINYCQGCGGSCHGNTVLSTYDSTTGQRYLLGDAVDDGSMAALKKSLVKTVMATDGRAAVDDDVKMDPKRDAKQDAARIEETVAENIIPLGAKEGIYAEGSRIYVNMGSFVFGCSAGSFYPILVPPEFIKPSFALLLARAP